MQVIHITEKEQEKLFSRDEGHFLDFKAIEIKPSKLLRTVSALANSDGGEIFVGISQSSKGGEKMWEGFNSVEDANGFIQAIEEVLPLGNYNKIEFLSSDVNNTFLLHIEIFKAREIIFTSSKNIYVRRGAQNLPILN